MTFSNTVKIELAKSNMPLDFKRLALKEAFLKSGFVADAQNGYHLEIVCNEKEQAAELQRLLKKFNLKSKITERKNSFLVYMKDGDTISDFLALIGSHKAVLEFENIRVLKETRNNVNRAVNCETANIGKIAKASAEQLSAIHYIENNFGLNFLPKVLNKTAVARLQKPEASLSELAEELYVGKSALSHRFKKIKNIAKKFGMGQD